jgi:hypothetical protein
MKRVNKSVGIVILLVVAGGAATLAYAFSNVREGYEPRQPIHFRHSRMAGEPRMEVNEEGEEVNVGGFAVPCLYCHTMPHKGRHSTLPSTATCMNCHETVGLDKEWVLKLKEYWERGEPIPWVRVHDLPDFVYYDHSAHLNVMTKEDVTKAKLECADCHGKVEEMDIVRVDSVFNMQWCLDCHRKPDMAGSTDCVACHR